jgi:quercetin dioxygenase-like cupin family protein
LVALQRKPGLTRHTTRVVKGALAMTHADADETAGPPAPGWPWPAALDAVQAAPAYHRVLLENAQVRVLETRVGPGERVPVHTHCWPSVNHVLSWSDFVRRDGVGAVLLDTRGRPAPAVPGVVWAEPLAPHSLENVGTGELRVVSVEVKTHGTTAEVRGA